jgi:hypothetical protein
MSRAAATPAWPLDQKTHHIAGGSTVQGTRCDTVDRVRRPAWQRRRSGQDFSPENFDRSGEHLTRIIHEASWNPDSLGAPRFVHE